MPKEEIKDEIKKRILVRDEVPKQEVRTVIDEEGNQYEVLTIEEALTEILENIRQIKKSVA